MIDAHVHIDQYGDDLPKALHQIHQLSIRTLAVSMDIPSYQKTLKISELEPLIIPSFGIHPWNAADYAERLEDLDEPLESASAIGEIGLDHRFVEDETRYPAQDAVFRYQLDAAEQSGKLINLHTSGAEALILDYLQARTLPAIIIHWYNGPFELVKEFLDLGAYFTIGVELLHSQRIQSLAAIIPEERILTETDNPGGWQWLHNEKGFPSLIDDVEIKLAEIRKLPRVELSELISSNFDELLLAGGLSEFYSTNA